MYFQLPSATAGASLDTGRWSDAGLRSMSLRPTWGTACPPWASPDKPTRKSFSGVLISFFFKNMEQKWSLFLLNVSQKLISQQRAELRFRPQQLGVAEGPWGRPFFVLC